MSAIARFRLFGRVAVSVGEHAIPVRGAMPAAILARLALTCGEPVPVDEFVADLWSSPPPTAAGTLRAHISRLRSAGLAEHIVGGRGGYTLADSRVDVIEFRDRAAFALSTRERDDLEAAEEAWRGEPFRDVSAPFVADWSAELHGLRRRVAESLAELRLDAGELDAVLGSLPAVVREHPDHEEPVRLLATALARAGRSTDALGAIDGFAERLRETQGLDVSPALAAARLSIVRQDPELVAPVGRERGIQHGVPLPITRFIGRSSALELVAAGRRESRLVTLTGPGGVGKSRLAVESLAESLGPVDSAQWLLELASYDTGEDVVLALSELVGATNATVESIAQQLSGRGALLVLDNAEHVLEAAAALVSALLAASPGLSVLVTSREPLRIPGERLIPIAPMLGDDAPDAIALFAERAADVVPGFALTDASLPLVRRLAKLLDGLPLALELTAARLDVMDLAELVRSIESEELLTLHGPAAGRHGSLQSTIEWSARMLRPAELELLAQLGNFAGSVTLDAIDGICVLPDGDVREVAAVLAQKSLLAVVGGAVRGRRYRLLESVKLYARQLPAQDDRERWRERHAQWFADAADELESRVRGPESAIVHEQFEVDRSELLAALSFSVARGDRATAVRLAGAMSWHWFLRGAVAEGKGWIDSALEMPGPEHPRADARAIWGAVMIVYRSGDKFGGEVYARRGLPLAERSGDPTLTALFTACNAMWDAEADPAGGLARMRRAEALLGDVEPWAVSEVLTFRSICHIYARKLAETMRDLQAALESALAAHNAWAAGSASWRLAHALIGSHRERDAVEQLVQCFDLLAPQGDVLAVILALHAAAIAVSGIERQRDGARLFGAVDRLGAVYGFPRAAINDDVHEGYRSRTKQALTAAEWNACYREGAALSLDEAVSLVRAVAASLPPRRR
ncbi:BTAD domain-containing putative transcriptional regulator [Salinibacterium soli]|uniref:BTAD domain-containing putative transcriptional regulator n=1 Tax=Antiquaquibacter soli TaxID=3064523 RepID=A0ABT9BP60_9MICO|nr:BTAD domain-containing putative transcriptional regulator [Protaetiibacter sp. WY-16]MDO7882813.1 BTAD domain-containing putative transcriptional regulator [Protaetiibacter sp. WY-16]